MTGSVDSRIVSMKFDNVKFERDVSTTMNTMDKLKKNLDFEGSTKGLDSIGGKLAKAFGIINPFGSTKRDLANLQGAVSNFSMSSIEGAVTHVSGKFLALSTVAITALSNITSKALSSAGSFVKGFTFGPILDGLHEYETNLKAIQTIKANTDQPLTKINKSLNDLNHYSDQTIYNFSEMARNIGTFTAAGVDLKTATSSIKGIANLAALAGSSSEQASTAMYQLSQAISAGSVSLQDWNSVVNAGMGGKKLQNALAQTGVAMGALTKDAVEMDKKTGKLTVYQASFRDSIRSSPTHTSWLTSDILVNTLATLDGRFSRLALGAAKTSDGLQKYTKAQIEAKIQANRLALEQKNGVKYTDAQFKSLMRLSDNAYESATKVKTLSQVFDVAKESIGSGWAASFQNIYGNLNQATKTFTGMSNFINNFINANALARNKVLHDWRIMGGRAALLQSIINIFKAITSVIKPIHDAFRDIFPRKTGGQLAEMTKGLEHFTKGLILGKDASQGLHDTFGGIFAILHIVTSVIGGFVRSIFSLIGIAGKADGGFLQLTGSIGHFFILLDKWLSKGDKIGKAFDKAIGFRAKLLTPLAEGVAFLASALAKYIRLGVDKAFAWMGTLGPYVKAFQALNDKIKAFALGELDKGLELSITYFEIFMGWVHQAIAFFGTWLSAIAPVGGALQTLGETLKSAATDGGATFLDFFKEVLHYATSFGSDLGQNIKTGVSNALHGITGIDLGGLFGGAGASISGSTSVAAAAIGAVALGLKALGQLAASAAKGGLSALASVFDHLGFDGSKVGDGLKAVFDWIKGQIHDFSNGLGVQDALAVINTGFLIALYRMFYGFVKTLKGIGGALRESVDKINGVLDQTTANLKTMQTDIKANIILKIAGALALLAVALLVLSRIPLQQLGQALGAVAALLLMVVLALKALTKVTDEFGSIKLVAIGGALVGISLAILTLAGAVALLGHMKATDLAKGLGAVAGIMVIVVAAAAALGKAGGAKQLLAAAFAIGIMAASLVAFAGAIEVFALLKTDTLKSGGIKIAATLGALALIMNLFPPNMLATAAAIAVVAASLVVITGAIKIFSKMSVGEMAKGLIMLAGSLAILAAAMALMSEGAPGAAALVVMAAGLALLVPSLVILGNLDTGTIVKSLLTLVGIFAALAIGGLLLAPVVPVLEGLGIAIALLGVAALAAGAGMLLFSLGLAGLAATGTAGVAVFVAAVIAFAQLLPLVMQQFALGIIAFSVVIGKAGPKFVGAFTALLVAMLQSTIKTTPLIGKALFVMIMTALKVVRGTIPSLVATGYAIILAMLKGLRDNIGKIVTVATDIIVNFLTALRKNIPKLTDQGAKTVIAFINGTADALRKNRGALEKAGGNMANALLGGMIDGLKNGAHYVVDAAKGVAGAALGGFLHKFKIKSPSRETHKIGQHVSDGLANGITAYSGVVEKASSGVAGNALDTITATMSKLPTAVADNMEFNPTITPVLDLTKMASDATKISGLLSTNPIDTGLALDQAKALSASQQAAAEAAGTATAPVTNNEVTFVQNNNSPKALDPVTIYRQSKNLLSLKKEELEV